MKKVFTTGQLLINLKKKNIVYITYSKLKNLSNNNNSSNTL